LWNPVPVQVPIICLEVFAFPSHCTSVFAADFIIFTHQQGGEGTVAATDIYSKAMIW
jgi:hypothetical protein